MGEVTSQLLQPSPSAPCLARVTRAGRQASGRRRKPRGCAVRSGAARGGANLDLAAAEQPSRGPRRGAMLAAKGGWRRGREESHPARRLTLARVPERRVVVAAGSHPSAPRTAPPLAGSSERAAAETAVAAAATAAASDARPGQRLVTAGLRRGAEGHTLVPARLAMVGGPPCPRSPSSGQVSEGCSAHRRR